MRVGLAVIPRVALWMLLALPPAAPSLAQAVAVPAGTPAAAVREFYHWYVHALNQNKNPLTGERAAMRRYVTARLIAEINRMAKGPDGLDGDYFIDAQDWDKEWETNIAVPEAVTRGATATVKVTLSGPQMTRHLQVTLKQEAAAWKVDGVKGLDN